MVSEAGTISEAAKALFISQLSLTNAIKELEGEMYAEEIIIPHISAVGLVDTVAEFLFAREHMDAYYLEYDDERSGSFEPLKMISEGNKLTEEEQRAKLTLVKEIAGEVWGRYYC